MRGKKLKQKYLGRKFMKLQLFDLIFLSSRNCTINSGTVSAYFMGIQQYDLNSPDSRLDAMDA
jgi:hypothetical protein